MKFNKKNVLEAIEKLNTRVFNGTFNGTEDTTWIGIDKHELIAEINKLKEEKQ